MRINPWEEYYQHPKEIINSNLDVCFKNLGNDDFHPKMSAN